MATYRQVAQFVMHGGFNESDGTTAREPQGGEAVRSRVCSVMARFSPICRPTMIPRHDADLPHDPGRARPGDTVMALTDAHSRNAKPKAKAYKLSDGGGMYLLVKPDGARYWRLDYRFAGKRRHGANPDVALGLRCGHFRHLSDRCVDHPRDQGRFPMIAE